MPTENSYEFTKLVVGEVGGSLVSATTQIETARFFGWDKEFEEWRARWKNDGWHPGEPVWRDRRRRGGDRRRICRSKSKAGYPRGMTHCFRMTGPWSRKHLVELARVAGNKFEWMEAWNYKKVDREVWLSFVKDSEG